MAVNKNFVVKNGLEVNTDLILANADTNSVGIGTTLPDSNYLLHVNGGIGATDVRVTGIATVLNELRVGTAGTVFTVIAGPVGSGQSVGIGTARPAYLLDVRSPVSTGQTSVYVQGDVRITGDLSVDDISFDDATVQNLTVTDTLYVGGESGLSTFVGRSNFENYVDLQEGLTVSGISTFDSSVDINSSVNISDNLNISGISTFDGHVNISNNINVTGVSTFNNQVDISNDLNVIGISTLSSVDINGGDINVSNINTADLNVTGIATIASISVVGAAFSDLNVTGTTELNGYVDINNSVDISDNLNVVGLTTLGGYVDINSSVDISGNLKVSGITTTDSLSIGSTQVISNTFELQNITSLDSTTTATIESAIANSPNTFTDLTVTGVSTLGTVEISSGIVTATTGIVTYYGDGFNLSNIQYSSVSGVSTALQTARTFEITGDIVSSPISFDGTSNVSLAATIQPNSVGLGTDTVGNYVKSVSGTANQITVTGGSGEGSTPIISITNNPILPGNVIVENDLQVNNNLNVNGNISVGGTTGIIYAQEFFVTGKEIIVGFTTDGNGTEVSNDTTANGGGIAIASTEGNPLVDFYIAGIHTHPNTYKDIIWIKEGTLGSGTTDAWHFNYAVGIGSTQVPNEVYFASGQVQFTESDLIKIQNVNSSGIITATSFVGDLTGTATTSLNLSDAANITTGTISTERLSGTYYIDISGSSSSSGTATTATNSDNINISATSSIDSTTSLVLVADQSTGNQSPFIDSGLLYDASVGNLSASKFTGSAQVGVGTSGVYIGLTTQFNFVGLGITITPEYDAVSGITTLSFSGGAGGGGGGSLGVSDDTTTNATRYILFDDATSGTITDINVSSTKLTFNPSTGDLVVGGTVTASSDEKLKTNIKTIENALDKVTELRGVEFDRIENGVHQIGVIAQEVEKIIPEVVYESDNFKSVAYGNLVGLLIEAIKEQNKKINHLNNNVLELTKYIQNLN